MLDSFYKYGINVSTCFYSKTNQMHQSIKFIYFGMTLHISDVFPSIIKISTLYIQQ